MIGTRVSLRLRMSARDAHYAGELVDGARVLALFGDLATELLIRLDGDEGLFRAYESIEFLAPVFAGDYIEASAELVRIGDSSRQIRFEARKVISNVRQDGVPSSAADVLVDPVVVCRAVGTGMTPKGMQRRPKELYMPALPAGPAPGEEPLVTPPASAFEEVILTAAIVGAEVTRANASRAKAIGDEAARCREAGAAVIHLHFRTADGSIAPSRERFEEAITAIREKTDCIVQVTTGGAVGMSIDERAQPLGCRPELATLHCGTINFGDDVLVSTRPQIRDLAGRLRKAGSVPVLECYEVGHVEEALALLNEGAISAPLDFQLVLGVPGGIGATEENLRYLRSLIPGAGVVAANAVNAANMASVTWGVAAVGRLQQPMTELAMRLGGQARVGLEENVYLAHGLAPGVSAGVIAEGSAPLVARAAAFAGSIGRSPVEPDRARTLLGIRPRNGT